MKRHTAVRGHIGGSRRPRRERWPPLVAPNCGHRLCGRTGRRYVPGILGLVASMGRRAIADYSTDAGRADGRFYGHTSPFSVTSGDCHILILSRDGQATAPCPRPTGLGRRCRTSGPPDVASSPRGRRAHQRRGEQRPLLPTSRLLRPRRTWPSGQWSVQQAARVAPGTAQVQATVRLATRWEHPEGYLGGQVVR